MHPKMLTTCVVAKFIAGVPPAKIEGRVAADDFSLCGSGHWPEWWILPLLDPPTLYRL